ncbi:hypothetical protein SLS58_004539 [Diplodia intermedia]|uniref:Arylsulfotransferase n=1 Tax=Diplodia intermedia TaxID=856260 RepID=A0ABR3TSZ2_9PEZI
MNAFDFRPIDYGGKKYLSLNVGRGTPSIYGAGLILSDTYEVVREVQMSAHTADFNQHEFNVIDDGAAALYVTEASHEVSGAGIGLGDGDGEDDDAAATLLWARSNGVAEESLLWGREETLDFEWDCIDRVPLNESTFPWPEAVDEGGRGWDYMHMNSIDKFPGGDYLVSMRYSDSLMRVGGSDGRIVWRLGGRASDFAMWTDDDDGGGGGQVAFSRQHHARIVSTNATHTVVTLLDNAAGSLGTDAAVTAPESAALVVRLHHDAADASRRSWAAELLRRYPRPDGAHSYLRGSVQLLLPPGSEEDETSTPYPSSLTHIHDRYPGFETTANVLACWSKDGYATEFAPDGSVVAEARFATAHLDTYRAFKHAGFVGRPAAEPPALRAFAFGDVAGQRSAVVDGSGRGVGQTMTVAYVSWNGATEVRAWRAFGRVVRDGGAVVLGGKGGKETYGEAYGLVGDDEKEEEEGEGEESAATSSPSPSSLAQSSSSSSSSSSHPLYPSSSTSTSTSSASASSSPSTPHTEEEGLLHHLHHRRAKIPLPSPHDPSDPPPPPTHLGTFARSGFETVLTIPNQPISHLWVEALDGAGAVLGRSPVVAVVVPAAQRPYAPVDVRPDGGDGDVVIGTGDFVFADEGEGFIGLVKVPPQAAEAGREGAWGYKS